VGTLTQESSLVEHDVDTHSDKSICYKPNFLSTLLARRM